MSHLDVALRGMDHFALTTLIHLEFDGYSHCRTTLELRRSNEGVVTLGFAPLIQVYVKMCSNLRMLTYGCGKRVGVGVIQTCHFLVYNVSVGLYPYHPGSIRCLLFSERTSYVIDRRWVVCVQNSA